MARDEFSREVREALAGRVGLRCSNPECRQLTSGPAADPARALNIGVAAHITAAAPGGPRFDATLTTDQRVSIENALWLCQTCGALVDRDTARFSIGVLRGWKGIAEDAAAKAIRAGSRFRPIAANEVRQEFTIGELAAIKALSDEFGCHIETEVHVPAGDGWVRLHGAVVRGEDLIAIDIRENHGKGIAYFQIEYLLDLCGKLSFERFQRCAVYLAVVSDGPEASDEAIRTRLETMSATAPVETHIRLYRLNALRAKYGL
jgi:hypothetical protein